MTRESTAVMRLEGCVALLDNFVYFPVVKTKVYHLSKSNKIVPYYIQLMYVVSIYTVTVNLLSLLNYIYMATFCFFNFKARWLS